MQPRQKMMWGKAMTDLIMPPNKVFSRARRWETFERLFSPMVRDEQSSNLIWEPWEVPKDADYRHWWTVLDPMTSGQLYLAAGFHFVNRLGYVQCANPWGGEWSEHGEFLY